MPTDAELAREMREVLNGQREAFDRVSEMVKQNVAHMPGETICWNCEGTAKPGEVMRHADGCRVELAEQVRRALKPAADLLRRMGR